MAFDYREAVQSTLPAAVKTSAQPSGNLSPSPLPATKTANFF